MLSIEGTRSYGIGLARAAKAAGIPVIEAEQPSREDRRGRGKSDPIDAHLAVLYAIGLDADKLPTPRADGDREALRILLCAREEMATTSTGHINRLKALLRTATTPTAAWPELSSPTPPCRGWPAVTCPARSAGSRPYATARSAASPWPCVKRGARSKPTASSSPGSSTTWSPGCSPAPVSDR